MFENVLGQTATAQLVEDINAGTLAPAMLFSGPFASGKGTAALELGRVISCEAESPVRAAWNCACSACSRHRFLIHPDLLCLGRRAFSAEIAASAAAFLRESAVSPQAANSPGSILFTRAIRKLLARFNPVLWEDEPKTAKISLLVNTLEEELDELGFLTKSASSGSESPSRGENPSIVKLVEGMKKNAYKLESEGMSETVPIAQIRRSAFWGRLAPAGNGKLLVIENADRVQDDAQNALLKLLEEPPLRLRLVLTSPRPGSLLPTILSRLRPYRFSRRDAAVEQELIRRVFKDQNNFNPDEAAGSVDGGISLYLDSFLPVSKAVLSELAAFFAASVAFKAAYICKKQGRALADEVLLLGKYAAPKAEAAGFGRPRLNSSELISVILDKADKFEIRSLFSRFLSCLLEQVSLSFALMLPSVSYNELWRKNLDWAEKAAGVYNLRAAQVLEKLFIDLSREMAEL